MIIHEFKKSLAYGKAGEEAVYAFLKEQTRIVHIWDVRENPLYQKKDIDFIIETNKGIRQFLEIKTDSYTSGNLYYEVLSSEHSKGCMFKTEASHLYYYYPNLKKLYIFEMDKFRRFMNENLDWFTYKGYKKSVKNKGYGASIYTSVGYAIPLRLFHMMEPKWLTILDFERNENTNVLL